MTRPLVDAAIAGIAPYEPVKPLEELQRELGHDGAAWGCNLIHSPNEPALEEAVADLYLARGVRKVSAAAYMTLTPAIVRYAYSGVHRDASGAVQRPNAVFATLSRPEVARRFLQPAPSAMLAALAATGRLTAEEAALAAAVPPEGAREPRSAGITRRACPLGKFAQ